MVRSVGCGFRGAAFAAGLFVLPRAFGALPFGIQSDDADIASTFATAMVYDPVIERVYITGASYGGFFDPEYLHNTKLGNRDCFLASLQLPTETDARGPQWLLKESYGERNTSEACTAIHQYRRDNGRAHLVTGHSLGSAGILGALQTDGSAGSGTDDRRIFGMILDSAVSGLLNGGFLLNSDIVDVPLSIHGAVDGSGDVFVSRVHSRDGYSDSQYSTWMQNQHTIQPDPDIRSIFLLPTCSSNYSASLTRLSPVQTIAGRGLDNTLELVWELQLGHIGEKLAILTDMHVYSNTTLLVAGFHDTAAGAIESFVSSVDAATGEIAGSMRITTSVGSTDDRASALCGQTGSRYAYVAGTTYSNQQKEASKQAFLVKLDIQTMIPLWSTGLKGLTAPESQHLSASVYGLGCAVAVEDEYIFLAGSVGDGATISLDGNTSNTRSAGGDDMFIAKIDSASGDILWVRQLGTKNDDTLALGNGIAIDKNGNGILLGNTRGSFMRIKKELGKRITNDVVVFSVGKEQGEHVPIKEKRVASSEPKETRDGSQTPILSMPNSTTSSSSDSTSHAELNNFQPSTNDDVIWSYPKATTSKDNNESKNKIILFAIIFVTILLLVSFYGLWWIRRQQRFHRQQLFRGKTADVFLSDETSTDDPHASYLDVMDMEKRSLATGDSLSALLGNNEQCRDSLLVFENEVVNYRSHPTVEKHRALNDIYTSLHHRNAVDS